MSNIGSYEQKRENFDRSISKRELEYRDGDPINIPYYCAERNCEHGLGDKIALFWENFAGDIAQFTYDEIRRYSNGCAKLLKDSGVQPGDRVCIYMDRIRDGKTTVCSLV